MNKEKIHNIPGNILMLRQDAEGEVRAIPELITAAMNFQ